jgi:AbrB family looped-hinge helix DNA binding protein
MFASPGYAELTSNGMLRACSLFAWRMRGIGLKMSRFSWQIDRMGPSMQSPITSRGRATIPKSIRHHLRLKPGDRIKFFIQPNGSVVMLRKLPASTLRGILQKPQRPV